MERLRLSKLVKDLEMGGDIDVVIAAEAEQEIEAIKADALDVSNAQRKEIDRLSVRVSGADAARRHAQAVSSELVKEKRALRDLLDTIKGELVDRYDGAPDSTTRWIGALIQDIEAATPGVTKSVVKESLTTESAAPSETVQSVTEWANQTFGKATSQAMMDRAKKEWDELLDLFHPPDHTECCIPKKVAEEAADVCICLYRVIGTLDPEAINKKMAKNRARKWQVDGQGCAQHVE